MNSLLKIGVEIDIPTKTFFMKLRSTIHWWLRTKEWRWPPKKGKIIGYRPDMDAYEIECENSPRTWLVWYERAELSK